MSVSESGTIAMILDSLRYQTASMGADGFRSDLATISGCFLTGFSPMHLLLVGMIMDPEASTSELIAEPWDTGLGGWQTGNFPAPFPERNDHYRDILRSFWLSDAQVLVERRRASGPNNLATRLAGSRDVYDHGIDVGRGPHASINLVMVHDGLTFADLIAYNVKHSWVNLGGNRDGSDDNRSWNRDIEDPVVSRERATIAGTSSETEDGRAFTFRCHRRTQHSLFTTLLLSLGTPMLMSEDGFVCTQNGNNNTHCQDSPVSWVDQELTTERIDQRGWTKWLIALRLAHPILHPSIFATGMPFPGDTIFDLSQYTASGAPMPSEGWSKEEDRVFQMLYSGASWHDHDALLIVNEALEAAEITPSEGYGFSWPLTVDITWPNLDGALSKGIKVAELNLGLKQVASGKAFEVVPISAHLLMSDVSYLPRRRLPAETHPFSSAPSTVLPLLFFSPSPTLRIKDSAP